MRNYLQISRTAAAVAIVLAALGCSTDSSKSPSDTPASPVTPIPQSLVSVSSSRTSLTANTDTSATLTVQAQTATFNPVPNGTDAVVTTTLGALDSPSGGKTVTIDLVNGVGTLTLFPGDAEGTARISATVGDVSGFTTVSIRPDPTGGVPPEPAPVQTTLTLDATPDFASEEDANTEITIVGTVLGSGGDPFRNAGVFFTTPVGEMDSGGAILKSDVSGKVFDTLILTDDDLIACGCSTFVVTGHLGIEGGEKTSTVTINVLDAPAPSVATSVELFLLPDATVEDDGGGDAVTLRAIVRDQFGDPMSGVTVNYSTQLGNLSAGSDSTNGSGIAEVDVNLSAGDLALFGPDSFTVSASIAGDSDTETVIISRGPAPAVSASFTPSTLAPCHDSLEGISVVTFTNTSTGTNLDSEWDLDGDGFPDDSTLTNPSFNYNGFTAGAGITVTLEITDGLTSDSATVEITPIDCIP